jgi:LysR family transcriptional regulator (chromosome initiation inhibitor)
MALLSPNLIAFSAIVRQGTVHGAAKELKITQTAVTQRIRVIERELGTTLFLRSRKGMTLTQEGQALLRYCKGALDLEGEVLGQIKGSAADSPIEITLTGPTSVMNARVINLCLPLYSDWPNLYLNFHISDEPSQLGMLRSGQAAMAIVPSHQVPQEMDSKKLLPDRYVLVGSPKWRRRPLVDILENERVIDFNESDQTTLNFLKKFELLSRLSKPRLFLNSNEAIARYFSRGVGFGTLTQEIAKPYFDSGELINLCSGKVLEDSLALVWYPRPVMPPYFKAIIRAIK